MGKHIYKVGMTGGIGCGKTTVANLFEQLGVPVLDADQISRQFLEPGQRGHEAVVEHFGPEILLQGHIDRAQLRSRIFADTEARHWLEHLLHPMVYAEMQRQMDGLQAAYCILVVPLLIETGKRDWVDRLLVVDCDPVLQRLRVKSRSQWTDAVVDQVLAAQVSRAERIAAADDLIVNDQDIENLDQQVRSLHARYSDQARSGFEHSGS